MAATIGSFGNKIEFIPELLNGVLTMAISIIPLFSASNSSYVFPS
jgi:hypothetical protein